MSADAQRRRSFGRLVHVEMRRALARRAVWALIAIALVGIAMTGVLAYFGSSGFEPSQPEPHIARLVDLWSGHGDSVLTSASFFLVVGALIGGATVTGAEWQHGTIVTLCTWEVRRRRLLGARIVSAVVLSFVLALALIAMLVLVLVPTYLGPGTTQGADATFWTDTLQAAGRMAFLSSLAAGTAAAVASIGRRTTVAVGAAFVYLAILESAVRGLWPDRARWLIGENAAIFLAGQDLDNISFTRGAPLAAVTLCLYTVAAVTGAIVVFHRRDIAGST